ncbi:MAG: hypothetical protein PW845_17195 [Pseudomonas sp.]|nr:hypothetical protein [Pseudomonas sp.]
MNESIKQGGPFRLAGMALTCDTLLAIATTLIKRIFKMSDIDYSTLTLSQRDNLFSTLALPDVPFSAPMLSARKLPDDDFTPGPGQEHGFVAGNTLGTIEGEMSLENEKDVKNFCCYAENVANRAYDPDTQVEAWYKKYNQTLSAFGFTMQSFGFDRLGTSDTQVSVDAIALKLLGDAALGAGSAGKVLLDTIRNGLNSIGEDQKALSLFEKRSSNRESANFQFLPSGEKANGTVVALLACSHFKSKENKGRVLFVSWNKSKIDIFGAARRIIYIASETSPEVRTEVRRWIAKNAMNQFDDFKLPDD